MQLNKLIITIAAGIIMINSCIEPFQPGTVEYSDVLFIEALITDSPDIPHQVKLSRSAPIQSSSGKTSSGSDNSVISLAETGALVIIERDDGRIYTFSETLTGAYYDLDDELNLEAGRYYKLIVQTIDGNTFESELEEYILPSPITEISYEPTQKSLIENGNIIDGLQFYVSTESNDTEPRYYRWVLEETYKYRAPFNAIFIWINNEMVEFSNKDFKNCWKTNRLAGIYTGNTLGLAENRVMDAPINFVSQFGDQLSIKYSLQAKQYAISESSYLFWNNLKKILYESGGLWEVQPFRVNGNISCVTDHDIAVSGIFEIAGVSDSRVFAPLPLEFKVYPRYCELDPMGTETNPWYKLPEGAFLAEIDPEAYATSASHCFICTERGGTTQQPAFWE